MTTAIRLFLDVVGDVILTCRDVVVSGKQVANLHKIMKKESILNSEMHDFQMVI